MPFENYRCHCLAQIHAHPNDERSFHTNSHLAGVHPCHKFHSLRYFMPEWGHWRYFTPIDRWFLTHTVYKPSCWRLLVFYSKFCGNAHSTYIWERKIFLIKYQFLCPNSEKTLIRFDPHIGSSLLDIQRLGRSNHLQQFFSNTDWMSTAKPDFGQNRTPSHDAWFMQPTLWYAHNTCICQYSTQRPKGG